jgi:uncharacterized damage-inducible protein DinB
MSLATAVVDAWHSNQRINQALLSHLNAEMLALQTPGGGMTIAQHLAHLCESLKYWASYVDREGLAVLPDLYDPAIEDDFVVSMDLAEIQQVFERTSALVLRVAQQAQHKNVLPHKSLELFLIHMMVHDAHHRGQILLTLKLAGEALPDEDSLWQPWKDS